MDLEAFYQKYYRMVYGYLLSLCHNRAMAEDLASETFLRAMAHIRRFDGGCRLSTWLCEIGKNLYLNELRRLRRQAEWDTSACGTARSPEEEWLEGEDARALGRAAEELPPVQQRVFYMRLHGFSFREIGAAMGKSENWARVTFFRSKARILERWEEWK